jgi:UDP-N-acetylmuramate dehydrogenase
MTIENNISLKTLNTFGLDYKADSLIHLKTELESVELFRTRIKSKKPLLILGSGSNILFTSDFKGTILRPEFTGIKIEESTAESVLISAGAGVIWDDLVEWTVNKGLSGLENLSLIPGTVGASPVQNIGAYGTEIRDFIVKVKTVSTKDGSIRIFNNAECEFAYRNSIFKRRLKGEYLVTCVYYKLGTKPLLKLSYGSLKEEVFSLGDESLKNVRQAVINIRRKKLPDPVILGNAGSFFKNPVVSSTQAASLKIKYPLMPVYENQKRSFKLAAGWLIDECCWKGKRTGDAGVHENQALVLVNYGNATGKEIHNLSIEIQKSVREKFGIELEPEVEIIGTI